MRLIAPSVLLMLIAAGPLAAERLPIEGFEAGDLPRPWIVNAPNENVSVDWSTDAPAEGKRALQLDFHFTAADQYLGVPIPVQIAAPFQSLHFQLRGDGSGVGYGIYLTDASGETHKFRDAGKMKVSFTGWQAVEVDVTGSHETWGGDKNGVIDYPVTQVTFEIGAAGAAARGRLAFDAIAVEADPAIVATAGSHVAVVSPAYRSEVKGDTPIAVSAPGYKTITARCWKQGEGFGAMAEIAQVELDEKGNGSFIFPADQFPHGPITLTITGRHGRVTDNCYLQLYNAGGVKWKQGIPAADPPAAKGLKLLFADDFDGPLSIGDGPEFRYYDHKPPRGETDFSFPARFVSHSHPNTPFAQVDTWLRIRASEKTQSAGIISSLHSDGSGFKVKAPAYFECRFIGPNAPGSWPAFWLMTDHMSGGRDRTRHVPCDELDIIEAYGGEGPKRPNAFDKYMISPHCWNQGDAGRAIQEKAARQLVRPTEMRKFGIPSTWYEAAHTYGCLVTETETIYYCDDIEVGRHATLPLCKTEPLFFMVNLATGGGWPVDLSRYDGEIDMYVDYIRVYGQP